MLSENNIKLILEMVLSMALKLMSNYLMFSEESINVVLSSLISNFLKDSTYNIEEVNNNKSKRSMRQKKILIKKLKKRRKDKKLNSSKNLNK